MKRTLISSITGPVPGEIRHLLTGSDLYDSSCSPEAKVYFIDKDSGYYLKRSAPGTLGNEAALDSYFHTIGLGARVINYITNEYDWLLTERVVGEDCTAEQYLDDPKRLASTIGQILRDLHDTDGAGCPIQNRTEVYVSTVEHNYASGCYDKESFPDSFGFRCAEDAIACFRDGKSALKCDTLLHGDYCLPNIMLNNFKFSGFIDLGCGGIGDRHVDLFWGAWTLWYNLHTHEYTDRFFDAYGRDKIQMDTLRVIASAEVFG